MIRRQNDQGFSLVEVMMVVAIIGLMASAVVLTLPSNDQKTKQTLTRLETALVALSRNSILSGNIIGLVITQDGFETVRLSDDGWVADNSTLKPEVRQWLPLTLTSLQVEGASLSTAATGLQPQLWFLPTGEHPAYSLEFNDGRGRVILSAAAASAPEVRYEN